MSTPRQNFATTQWTLVWQAASDDSNHSRPALEHFIQSYWQPLYYYARQNGLSLTDAEDATQEFLSEILDGKLLSQANPIKGRFRSYLLTAWKRFLVDEYRKAGRQKAGGNLRRWSIDTAASESGWQLLASRNQEPDRAFTLAWANSVLAQVQQQLSKDYLDRGRQSLFQILWPMLTQPLDAAEYDRLAKHLGMSASSVKVAIHRLRQRYGETLRAVVADTVDDASEVDRELAELLEALRS
ncbi:MAG: hypothetical protein U0930_13725 [Pirellulales bacterium]